MEGEVKICPLCGMEVDECAEECPFCGADLRSFKEETAPKEATKETDPLKTSDMPEMNVEEPEPVVEVVSEAEYVVSDVRDEPVLNESVDLDSDAKEIFVSEEKADVVEDSDPLAIVEDDPIEVVDPEAVRPLRYKHIPDYVPREYSRENPAADVLDTSAIRGGVEKKDNKSLFWLIIAVVLLVCLCGCCFIGILALKIFGG